MELCHFAYLIGSSVNGVEEPSIAKRLRGTPERIELENYRLSVKQAEELEEVPEETQAEHNLSSALDKGAEEDVASRSACARGLQPVFLCVASYLWFVLAAPSPDECTYGGRQHCILGRGPGCHLPAM